MSYSKAELIQYRLNKAKEAFTDADYLARAERWNAAANRMYYACFHVVSAYLAFKDLHAVTHAGLKAAFNLELVKSGKVDRADGLLFNRLFSIRQQADYEDFVNLDASEIVPLIPKVKQLIEDVVRIIEL